MYSLIQRFFDRFKIKNKIIIACIPFIVSSYILIFLSITLLMYKEMKATVYQQTAESKDSAAFLVIIRSPLQLLLLPDTISAYNIL